MASDIGVCGLGGCDILGREKSMGERKNGRGRGRGRYVVKQRDSR